MECNLYYVYMVPIAVTIHKSNWIHWHICSYFKGLPKLCNLIQGDLRWCKAGQDSWIRSNSGREAGNFAIVEIPTSYLPRWHVHISSISHKEFFFLFLIKREVTKDHYYMNYMNYMMAFLNIATTMQDARALSTAQCLSYISAQN